MSKKSEKTMEGRRKSPNEIFRKDVAHDNIKSHKKTGFRPIPIKLYLFIPISIFGKTTEGGSNRSLQPF